MNGEDKVIVPLKYKIQATLNQVVPDKVVAKQSLKKHEPREDEERDEQRG